MSNFPYKEFSKQAALLAEYHKLSDEEKDKTILMGADLDKDGHMIEKNLKHYAMSKYDVLNLFFLRIPEKYRCYYELLKLNEFCKVYFDIDGIANEENTKKMEYLLKSFHLDFITFWKFIKRHNEGGCEILRDHNTDKTIIPGTMNIYTSTNVRKISYHILFPEIVMQNNFHCGAINRRFELWAIDKFGEDLEKNPYFFVDKDEGYEFALDRSVYSPNRLIRILYNSKAGQNRFLKPFKVSMYDDASEACSMISFEEKENLSRENILKGSFIQQIPLHNMEYFSICEVRSASYYENINFNYDDHDRGHDDHHLRDSDMSSASLSNLEWIEPFSIGSRIVSMTPLRIKRLKLIKYLKKSDLNNLGSSGSYSHFDDHMFFDNQLQWIGLDSPDSWIHHSSLDCNEKERHLNNIHIISENLIHFSNTVMEEFKIATSNSKNSSKHYANLMLVAEKYLRKRCTPDWWPRPDCVSFGGIDPAKTVNIRAGTIHLYPKGIKRCQFKGFREHSGNHIYFVIFTNKIYGNVGFHQKCHSIHHDKKPSNVIHPVSNDYDTESPENFEYLQKKMKSYTKSVIMKHYPIVHFPNPDHNTSLWIVSSVFLYIFQHFIKSLTNNYFSLFNQISNSQFIRNIVMRLINQIWYYLSFSKSQTFHKIVFRLVDEIMIRSFSQIFHSNKQISLFFLRKYRLYRFYLIQFSLSNVLMKNNFNNLNEKDFLLMIKTFSGDHISLNENIISKRKNNSILYITQTANLIQKKITDRFDHLISSPKSPNVIDEEKYIINVVVDNLSSKLSLFLENNYNYLKTYEEEDAGSLECNSAGTSLNGTSE